jgi:hypothetical protein
LRFPGGGEEMKRGPKSRFTPNDIVAFRAVAATTPIPEIARRVGVSH